jgi:drug/metabolite transporter (DMT)-like permease
MKLKNFLLLIFLACLWGPSFLFIKVAVGEIPPLTLVTGRVGLAALILYIILRLQQRNLPGFGPIWKHFAVVGFFSNALPFVLFSWGEQYIDSALASILNGTTPLFTALLAHFFISDERLNATKLIGIAVGFGGLVLLIAPSLGDGAHTAGGGLLAITLAAACYGIAMVYTRKNLRKLPPLVGPTAQLLMATLYMMPLAFWFEQPFSRTLPGWPALGSLLGLSMLGTALAFVIYYRLLEITGATYVAMVTYLSPVIGVILGVVILNERLGWNTYAGFTLILLGVMVVNGVFKGLMRRRLLTGEVGP